MNATPAFPTSPPESPSALLKKIQHRITSEGAIPFSTYMAMALYDPDHGYYTADSQRVGKAGDFITSVSIGRCFGMILAHRLESYWSQSEKPNTFHIIEPGAHDGSLCADILAEIQTRFPEFYQAVHYNLIEATPALITAQRQRLSDSFEGKFTSHSDFSDLKNLQGALISNELVDAFPVELIQFLDGEWKQLMVNSTEENSLTFQPAAITDPALSTFCQSLGTHFPDGYTTEFNPNLDKFSRSASESLTSGLMITVDYGHSTEDYYHPDRTTGTLQTYYKHQKAEDPLIAPGEIDITCHVDFTRLQSAAEEAGFHSASQRTQASYLTDHARNWLLDIENPDTATDPDTPNLLRQFQSLIHPAMLGTKFTVLEMAK